MMWRMANYIVRENERTFEKTNIFKLGKPIECYVRETDIALSIAPEDPA